MICARILAVAWSVKARKSATKRGIYEEIMEQPYDAIYNHLKEEGASRTFERTRTQTSGTKSQRSHPKLANTYFCGVD